MRFYLLFAHPPKWQLRLVATDRTEGLMPYDCGLHSSAEQINNMADYESRSLLGLIKLLRNRNAKIAKRKAHLCAW